MKHSVRVAVTSLATLEAVSPPYNLGAVDPRQNLERGISILEAAGAQGADIALLPETFMGAGMSSEQHRASAEPMEGPSYQRVAEQARKYSMNVVAGFLATDAGRLFNTSVLINREGRLAGLYRKQFLTSGEIDAHIEPGDSESVFDADFGRIGLATCFDLNFPAVWNRFEERKVALVCWVSAYDGGFPLRALAWRHQYPIATSVMSYNGRLIDITGRYLASTSRWTRVAMCDVNIDKRLFHTDGQAEKILELQKRYGQRIRIEGFTEEHLFSVEPIDENLNIEDLIRDDSLMDLKTYMRESEEARSRALARVNRKV
jgi:predicted amidohydrolase